MGKILALDFGAKRIGYAVSDTGHTMAFPRGVFAHKSDAGAINKLRAVLAEEEISKIIIGVALGEENEETFASEAARKFGAKLESEFGLPMEFVDEFGSTGEARGKIPFRKDRRAKGGDDAIAAQIILERYFDNSRKNRNNRNSH